MFNSRRGMNLLFNLLLLLLVLLLSLLIHQIVRFSSIDKAFTRAPNVAPVSLILVFLLLDMAKWMVNNIILSRIHGVRHGVTKDIFWWLATRVTNAVLLLLLVILLFEALNNTEKTSGYFSVSRRSFLLFLLHFFSETATLFSFFLFLFPIPLPWFPYQIFLSLTLSIRIEIKSNKTSVIRLFMDIENIDEWFEFSTEQSSSRVAAYGSLGLRHWIKKIFSVNLKDNCVTRVAHSSREASCISNMFACLPMTWILPSMTISSSSVDIPRSTIKFVLLRFS